MKKNLFVIMSFLLLVSCYDDKGSYDYHDINEITISGISDNYKVTTGVTTLEIDPDVVGTMGIDNVEYEWRATVPYNSSEVIGTERKLVWAVNLAPGSNYKLYFRVKDKVTGVTSVKVASLNVGTPYSRGIMLMGENRQGEADVQMIAMNPDTMIVRDILKDKGLPALHGPIDVMHTGSQNEHVWVLTKDGGYYVDRASFKGDVKNNFRKLVFTSGDFGDNFIPADVVPRIKNINGANGSSYDRVVVTTAGYVYVCSMFLNGGDFYQDPLNRTEDNSKVFLKANPYLMYALNSYSGCVWYDETNDRFMFISSSFDSYSKVLTDFEDDVFSWNQKEIGRKMIYAENTFDAEGGSANGNSFAVLKDKDGNSFIYKFYVQSTGVSKRNYYEVQSMAVDFGKADFYAFSSRRTVVYYTVGSKLYAYDYNKGNERFYLLKDFGSKQITMLKMDTQIETSANPLYIATYDEAEGGTLQKFSQGMDPDKVTVEECPDAVWSGLTKIKSMSWRAVN